jgi:hypothetical protein
MFGFSHFSKKTKNKLTNKNFENINEMTEHGHFCQLHFI